MRVPLHKYPVKDFLLEKKQVSLPSVFVLEAKPIFPVKRISASLFRLDLFEFKERFGISSVDAIGITVSPGKGLDLLGMAKLDLEKGVMLDCLIHLDGHVRIVCNDDDYANEFFDLIVPFKLFPDWDISAKWTNDETEVSIFMGGMLGSLSRTDVLDKASSQVRESVEEAIGSYEAKNWKSTVVMSRRAIEAVLKDAYKKFFRRDPMDSRNRPLNLHSLLDEFERSTFIPKHWLKILDAIRLLGNIPGAHPVPIPDYKFTAEDALLALSNTKAFLTAYYKKIS